MMEPGTICTLMFEVMNLHIFHFLKVGILIFVENIQKIFFRELDLLISRVSFLTFSCHSFNFQTTNLLLAGKSTTSSKAMLLLAASASKSFKSCIPHSELFNFRAASNS